MGNAKKSEDPAAGAWSKRSAAPRPVWKRRPYQVAASIGLAALLGTGAFVVTRVVQDGSVAESGGNLGPMAGAGPVRASGSPTPGATSPATTSPATPKPSASRSAAAGSARDLPKPPAGKVRLDSSAVTLTSSGSLPKDGHTLHVWSARADLSAQREMTLAGDAGQPVGKARCTQKFRFTEGSAPVEKPTALLCWRFTPSKSVYLLAVDIRHRPSKKAAAATINKVWKKMG
jgi:hypothetical protein